MIDEIYKYTKLFRHESWLAVVAVTDIELYYDGWLSERDMILSISKFLDDVLEESERVDKMRAWVNRKYFELV